MTTALKTPSTVDEYIERFPAKTQNILRKLRQTIKTSAPKAEEMISYGIAGYKYLGMLIYFAGWENHISVYPAPRQHKDFKKELSAYKGGKGTVQFPLGEPIPFDLVKKIIKFRIKENEEKFAVKSKKLRKPVSSKTKK